MATVYEKIITMFQENNIKYNEIEHHHEGYGENVAKFHALEEKCGAKALLVKLKKPDSYCLVVLSFNRRLDSKSLQKLMSVKSSSFASLEESMEMTQCEIGAIPPFVFNKDLMLVVDNAIKENARLFFNIGRLDRSVAISTDDYVNLVSSAKFSDVSQ